jgi:hypothetical protein
MPDALVLADAATAEARWTTWRRRVELLAG